MTEVKEKLFIDLSAPPHIKANDSINKIMWTMAAVLMLPAFYSVYISGLHTAYIIAVCVLSGVSAETVFQLVMQRRIRVLDGSSVITGMLVGMNVPPQSPLWMPAIGTVFAVVAVKELFGGLGLNLFNPALAGRALMMAIWPVHMTTGWHIFPSGLIIAEKLTTDGNLPDRVFNAVTQATPLTALFDGGKLINEYNISFGTLYNFFIKNNILKSLITGNVGGCIGEAPTLLLLICCMILLWRKIITWHIPVTYIGSAALLSYLYYSHYGFSSPGYTTLIHIFSGGLLFGAIFMATDMVTTPLTSSGKIIFGIGCGLITVLFRIKSGYPEGVCYAILIMNATVPIIDRFTKPSVFGLSKKLF